MCELSSNAGAPASNWKRLWWNHVASPDPLGRRLLDWQWLHCAAALPQTASPGFLHKGAVLAR